MITSNASIVTVRTVKRTVTGLCRVWFRISFQLERSSYRITFSHMTAIVFQSIGATTLDTFLFRSRVSFLTLRSGLVWMLATPILGSTRMAFVLLSKLNEVIRQETWWSRRFLLHQLIRQETQWSQRFLLHQLNRVHNAQTRSCR